MFKQINERMVNFMNENAMRKHEKNFKKTSHLPLPILVNCYDLKISPCLIPSKSAMQLTFQFTGFDFICSISVVEYLWLATKQHNFNTLRSNICPLIATVPLFAIIVHAFSSGTHVWGSYMFFHRIMWVGIYNL